ncbi:MAG: hypothetical protein ACYC2O_11235 [Microthrixaceae bacterium]
MNHGAVPPVPTTSGDASQPPSPQLVAVCGVLVVIAAGALVVVRFVGEAPLSRNAESLLASVALGGVVAAPGVLVLVAERSGRPSLLLAAAFVLAPLSLLSIATIPLLVVAVVLAGAWARRRSAGSRWRGTGAVVVATCGCIAAGVLLFAGTTTRTFTDGTTVHGTDGWIPWSTSIAVVGLVAAAVMVGTCLAPQRATSTRQSAALR